MTFTPSRAWRCWRNIKDALRYGSGSYRTLFWCADGGCLCPSCVRSNWRLIVSATRLGYTDRQWQLIAAAPYWEGEPILCDHCSTVLESEYGTTE